MAKQESMTFKQFQKQFQADQDCYNHLYAIKWPEGFKCPKCLHTECYTIVTRNHPLYQCTSCRHQTSLTVGTIFEKARISLRIWFALVFFVSHDKRGVSASLMAKELEISYKTAWTNLHKIRKACMADKDAPYKLFGQVEMDDFYIGAPTENGKRGRGTDKNQVLVALSKNAKGHPLYVKMEMIEDIKGTTVLELVSKWIEEQSVIQTDAYRSFPIVETKGYKLEAEKFDHTKHPEHLKWMHKLISNFKAFVLGTFHGLDSRYLQSYLDEFCFRFNRRKFAGQLFNRLLHACVSTDTLTYTELTS
ncbi:MAG: family transposase [Bacilli bacterium]|nr:family transposase [Bacilli bacterium]